MFMHGEFKEKLEGEVAFLPAGRHVDPWLKRLPKSHACFLVGSFMYKVFVGELFACLRLIATAQELQGDL
ncbi:hypothetical protein [Prochlorococcus sp. MIT 1303]|uniref:hypothetical protein n=1 Tax=Prochlorococcus sp. MIT 1303 TaxID=1723647 RepID=UPI0007BC5F92|nr:hypothetical protein [Prochlorococcus sp. MIT 1303]KZR69728.1 hypothetical protein PMIT1303_00059 [Prochlorococcus sp. MIT 1303]